MKFKCPVCGSILTLESPGKGVRIQCNGCETSFCPEKIQALHKQQQATRKAASQTTTVLLQSQNSNDNPQGDITGIQTVARQIDPHTASLARISRKRSRTRIVWLTALTVFAIGLLTVLINVTQKEHPTVADSALVDRPEVDRAVDELPLRLSDEKSGNELEQDLEPPLPPGPFGLLDRVIDLPPKPRNKIKTSKVLNDCRFGIQPFLVEVRAETPTGPRFATGTIIDSRGWLLTSYRAVQGATRIDIRRARQSLDNADSSGQLTDQVRGVVCSDTLRDLILLSINRRFVTSLNELPIADSDDLVTSQYLVQCCPPVQIWPYPVLETRIVQRINSDKFPPHLAKLMSQQNFTDKQLRWIQHEQISPLKRGAPLFSDDGTMVAVNTAATGLHERDVYAVPSKYVLALKQQASDEFKPLPVPLIEAVSYEPGEATEKPDGPSMNVVRSGAAHREISESLNRSGEQCRLFEFLPTSEIEFGQLNELVRLLLLAQAESQTADDAEAETLQQQIADWTGQLEQHLGIDSDIGRDQKKTFNQIALRSLNSSDGPFIGFAFVHYSAMESPKVAIGQEEEMDTIVFEFMGSKEKIISNLDPSWPPLPPDSPWLIIGSRIRGQVRLLDRKQQGQTISQSQVSFVFQSDAP